MILSFISYYPLVRQSGAFYTHHQNLVPDNTFWSFRGYCVLGHIDIQRY